MHRGWWASLALVALLFFTGLHPLVGHSTVAGRTAPPGHGSTELGTAVGPAPSAPRSASLAKVWGLLSPATAPSPRSHFGSAWDPALGGFLIFGGCVGGVAWGGSGFCTMTAETWAFVDGQWENLSGPGGPSARVLPRMAYDPTEGGVLLFGGATGTATSDCDADTWLFGISGWMPLTPSTSPGCTQVGMTFDGNLGHILLVAAASGSDFSGQANLTWEFSGGTWTKLPATSSFDRADPMIAYDSTDKETVLFGGFDISCGCQNLGDTWVFSGGNWSQVYPSSSPGARNQAGVADDPADGGVLMFAGHYAWTFYNDTWLFHGGTWTQITTPVAPTYRWAIGMDRNPSDGSLVEFGGYNYTGSVAQYTNETWTYAYPSPITSVGLTIQPSSIPLRDEAALTVQVSGGLGSLSYRFSGLPPGCTGGNLSLLLCVPSAVGTYSIGVDVIDQVGHTGHTTAVLTVTPAQGPPPLALSEFLALPSIVASGAPLTLVTLTVGGSGGNSYTYAGLPGGCLTADTPTLTCMPTQAGSFTITVTIVDSASETVTGTVPVVVTPAPGVPTMPTVSAVTELPDPATVGQLMAIVVASSGGAGPLTFSFTGLPAGCSSENASTIVCVPTAPGTSTITVVVSDSLGRQAQANLSAAIVAAPSTGGSGTGKNLTTPSGEATNGGTTLLLAVAALVVGVLALLASLLLRSRSSSRSSPPRGPGPR